MQFLKVLAGALFFLGLMLFLVDLFAAPKVNTAYRSAVIETPAEAIYPHLASFEKRGAWSPWSAKDPNMTKNVAGTDGAVGAVYSWSGNEAVGSGSEELTKLETNKVVESKLTFKTPYEGNATATIKLDDRKEKGTKVTWKISSNNDSFMTRMLSFVGVINLDKEVGADFEKGLADLKSMVESEYTQVSTKEAVGSK